MPSPKNFLLRRFLPGLSNKPVMAVGLLLLLVFFVLSLASPFPTDDLFMYSLIGRAIYARGAMPFDFAFDHKPVFTYYLYGAYTLLFPDGLPKFQILNLAVYGLSALVTRRMAPQESWPVHFLVIVGLSMRSLGFTANTQLFFAPLALISVFLVVQGRSVLTMAAAGVLAAIAFNINYTAALVVGPAVLFALATGRGTPLQKMQGLLVYGLGFLVAFGLILAPLLTAGMHQIGQYFSAQQTFLQSYNKWETEYVGTFLLAAGLMLALGFACRECAAEDRRLRNTMWVMLGFSLASTLPAGKFYPYYLYILVLPLTVLYGLSSGRSKQAAVVVVMLVLAAMAIRPAIKNAGTVADIRAAYDFDQFRALKGLVGDAQVLTIRAHPSIVYFSDIHPAQPLVWTNHAEFLYGPREDAYFAGHLEKRPRFVMTMGTLCANQRYGKFYPLSCEAIARDYVRVMEIRHPFFWKTALVYRLKGA